MSILDEKQQGPSLNLIVIVVSLVTFGAFGTMFLVHNGQQPAPALNTQQAQARSQPTASDQQQTL